MTLLLNLLLNLLPSHDFYYRAARTCVLELGAGARGGQERLAQILRRYALALLLAVPCY